MTWVHVPFKIHPYSVWWKAIVRLEEHKTWVVYDHAGNRTYLTDRNWGDKLEFCEC